MPDLLSTILNLATGTKGEAEVKKIPVKKIVENPHQPREVFDEKLLEELSLSIKEFGVIQPIIVRRKRDKYELVVGERRLRATKMAGLSYIPAIVRKLTDEESLALALIENLQRKDLNPIEEANVYLKLITELKLTQREIAQKVGKSPYFISNMLKLLRLPEEIKRYVSHETISKGQAFLLLKLPNKESQMLVLNEILNKNLSIGQTERLIKKILSKNEVKEEKPKKSKEEESLTNPYPVIFDNLKRVVEDLKSQGNKRVILRKIMAKDYIELRVRIPRV